MDGQTRVREVFSVVEATKKTAGIEWGEELD